MEWSEYKSEVEGSRQLIAFPYFERQLAGETGNCVDIGCGSGELTARIGELSTMKMLGIDIDEDSLSNARSLYGEIHFVKGDVGKNAVANAGVQFNAAISNCCLCHLSDRETYNLLLDLASCMKEGAKFVFLVPSISWAKKMYSNVEFNVSGVTALPRFGGRQYFRTRQWYVSALEKCGFDLIDQTELLIHDDTRLEERYLSNVGSPLFSAFSAMRASKNLESEAMNNAFDVAHDNRKMEIQLFWQRSLFFWGFVAAALVGYGAAYDKSPGLEIVFALFGLVCSVVWSAGNRGSKYWQEYWEEKVNFYQHYKTGNIFYDRNPKKPGLFEIFSGRRVSVSKLTMALSDYSVALWLTIAAYSVARRFFVISEEWVEFALAFAALLTLVYCLLVLDMTSSED